MTDTEWWRLAGCSGSPAHVLGRNVAFQRKRFGWDQAALARRLSSYGFAARQNTISRIENATRPVPVDELLALGLIFSSEVNRSRKPSDRMDAAEFVGWLLRDSDVTMRADVKRAVQQMQARVHELQDQRDGIDAEMSGLMEAVTSLETQYLGGAKDGKHQAKA